MPFADLGPAQVADTISGAIRSWLDRAGLLGG
jgi:hypothetical protein